MKNINDEKYNLMSIMKSISKQFGDKCEVVLHDFSQGFEKSVIAIENGHVTNRNIGSSITNLGLEYATDDGNDMGIYNYTSHTKDGKILRSSTAILRDEEGKIIGSLCINFDISDFLFIENTIRDLTMSNEKLPMDEMFVQDVNELFEYYIEMCIKIIGKPISIMTKEDKIKAIEYLDSKGVFSITKSGDRVCELFNISKFTLYKYLDEIRK
ncbi:helix-turn-helix transcriptional regulator [Lederbergia panacisoli]|uniref:helix-turn-helix transcriptional regulator n=1 Tax=Lederbergia panacisoli TaxID=1255251 RepID=UPI00214CFCB8|nr:helix-turn-helix transcriptional regulator [Lederbergia panacisoli]MCR2820077.1 helix-turn-helix transcriptional regulator [Lederbergia panacisoli]